MDTKFKPYTKLKPYHKMTFLDYEITINGDNIEFDKRIDPQQLNIEQGDKFVAKIDKNDKIILEKINKDGC